MNDKQVKSCIFRKFTWIAEMSRFLKNIWPIFEVFILCLALSTHQILTQLLLCFFLTGIDQFSPTQHWKTNATFGFTLEYFFPANSTQKRFAQCLDSWSSLFHEKFQCTLKYESVGKLVKRLITVEQCMGCPSFSCALFC